MVDGLIASFPSSSLCSDASLAGFTAAFVGYMAIRVALYGRHIGDIDRPYSEYMDMYERNIGGIANTVFRIEEEMGGELFNAARAADTRSVIDTTFHMVTYLLERLYMLERYAVTAEEIARCAEIETYLHQLASTMQSIMSVLLTIT